LFQSQDNLVTSSMESRKNEMMPFCEISKNHYLTNDIEVIKFSVLMNLINLKEEYCCYFA